MAASITWLDMDEETQVETQAEGIQPASQPWLDTTGGEQRERSRSPSQPYEPPAIVSQPGDYVKHWDSNRVGLVKYVGLVRYVLYFEDDAVEPEQWRWITAFVPATIAEDRIWMQQYRMRQAAMDLTG